ncbi:MAG: DUF4012 domain-containing protein [Actinomycetota bacterium]
MSVATLVVILLVVLGSAGISALGVRRHLLEGRDALARGKSELIDGDAASAQGEFDRAREAFRAGADGSRSIWLSLAGSIPFVGNTPDTVRAVADAGLQTADAADGLAAAVADLPGGLSALAPTAAGIPIDRLSGLTEATARADELTGRALATLEAAPTGLVLSPVASAWTDALDQLAALHRQLHAGSLMLQRLPSFLGADGPRRYFFGASNPAELRGTGGLIGAYAILTVESGRMSFSDFRPTWALPAVKVADFPSPSPEYSKNFDFYLKGGSFWVNLNMTPDFPLAAEAIWSAYRTATGQTLDGVIVADPFALKALMHVTPPVEVGRTGIEVTEDNIVPFVSNKAYALFDTSQERKLVLGRVAEAVVQGFLVEKGKDLPRLQALLDAFSDGHVKAWSVDPSMEAGLALTTVGGAFRPSGTEVVSVVTNSASGTKLDFYQQRTVIYDVHLGPGGTATAALRVDLMNDSPTSGLPAYVIGPSSHFSSQPGENIAVVDLYCDVGCVLLGATRDGHTVELDRHEQEGYPFFEDYVRTPSGDTATVVADLLLTQAWEGDETGGTYELSFVGQTTIRPTVLEVAIDPPVGMRFTSASDGLTLHGDRLMYEGKPVGNLDLRATFAPSLPVRLWRELVQAVT